MNTVLGRIRSTALIPISFTILVGSAYYVTHLYLSMSSYEAMMNWYSSQALEIEEGNLLNAVTKIQKMKNNSEFIKGVVLLDTTLSQQSALIQFGEAFDVNNKDIAQDVSITDNGFFKQQVMMRIPKRPELLLVFSVSSAYLRNIFLSLSSSLLVLFTLFRFLILKNRNGEVKRRENLVRESLSQLLSKGSSSEILEKEHPNLVSWWNTKKLEFDQAQLELSESRTQVMFAEMAARVAHDIRSPLGVLKSAIEHLSEGKKLDETSLKFASSRLSKITKDLVDWRTLGVTSEQGQKRIAQKMEKEISFQNLINILNSLINEKRLLYGHLSGILFELKNELDMNQSITIDADNLFRHISNLIDNSVEALGLSGLVRLSIKNFESGIVLVIEDNGPGISSEILQSIGQIGVTTKSNGSGMGVYYAKEFVSKNKGQFSITSEQGNGTIVEMRFPLFFPKLRLKKDFKIAFLDDDPLVHYLWSNFAVRNNVVATAFFVAEDYNKWAIKNPFHYLFCDHDLKSSKTGLEVLKKSPWKDTSFLVTNSYDDSILIESAKLESIPVVSKDQFWKTNIEFI